MAYGLISPKTRAGPKVFALSQSPEIQQNILLPPAYRQAPCIRHAREVLFVKPVVIALVLGLGLILAGCGTSSGNNSNSSAINGNWTASLTNPDGTQEFNFTTTLTSTSSTGVTVSNLTFTTQSPCFSGGTTASGAFTLTGTTMGVTSGGYQMTIQSVPPANTLTLTGTLTNTTITGTWTLAGVMSGCNGNGNFTMTHS